MSGLRARALGTAFDLLYNRFVLFHEVAGNVVFGEAWHRRRLLCLDSSPRCGSILDLGAGDGRLIESASRRCIRVRGVEPSLAMRSVARSRGVITIRGSSFDLPLPARSVGLIVSTYPGRWILDSRTWREIDRVLAGNGEVRILLGGTYESGPLALLRRAIAIVAYGRTRPGSFDLEAANMAGFRVRNEQIEDTWGTAILLTLSRSPS